MTTHRVEVRFLVDLPEGVKLGEDVIEWLAYWYQSHDSLREDNPFLLDDPDVVPGTLSVRPYW